MSELPTNNSNRNSSYNSTNLSNSSTKNPSQPQNNANSSNPNIKPSNHNNSILLVEKTATINKNQLNSSQTPFELTIRVDVNLPFNQRTAVRIKPEISLNDLLTVICKEASLEKSRYDLLIFETGSENGQDKRLAQICMNDSFDVYNTKEVTLTLKGNLSNYFLSVFFFVIIAIFII